MALNEDDAAMRNCPSCGEPVDDDAVRELRCPRCAAVLTDDVGPADTSHAAAEDSGDAESTSRQAGLWRLMSQGAAPPAEKTEAEASAPESASDDSAGEDDDAAEQADADAAAPKGLWSMMQRPVDTGDDEPEGDIAVADSPPARTDEDAPESPKGLWSLMKPAAATDDAKSGPSKLPPLPDETSEPVELDALAAAPPDVEDDFLDAEDDDEITDEEHTEEEPTEDVPSEPAFRAVRSRGATLSLLLGLGAVPASLLSLFPQFWMRIPTTVLGFSALLIGYLALGEIRRSRGKQIGKSFAVCGMSAGTIAMFLGPFLVTQFGETFRQDLARRRTKAHLTEVGTALNSYRLEHEHFPPGSRHIIDMDNGDVALHNWMTMLLPYLGEDAVEIHGAIDFNVPYNNEVNHPAMKRDVSAFHAAGADASKAGNGFAVAHFVALGGQRDIDGVGRVNIGIFSRNSRVTIREVEDGLAHTLVAGEIAYDFPAWGEPNVYRGIGKGLNKDRDGFGNYDRSGAMFLKADGSVQFFSNAVDIEVLRKLSTRDGEEKVELDY